MPNTMTTSVDARADMDRRLRMPYEQELLADHLLDCESTDVESVLAVAALPGAGDAWVMGQEIVPLPGLWPVKRVDGAPDPEPQNAAYLMALAWLCDREGRVAVLRLSRYAGMLLRTYEVI